MAMNSASYAIAHSWEEPQELHDLLEAVRDQRPDADIPRIRFAYYLAEQAHAGQVRESGEPYVTHPLAVARILVELRMDDDSVVAALLHDVLEDTSVTSEQIRKLFGDDVLSIVEGVTKLKLQMGDETGTAQRTRAETARAAENLRKMLLAMARDFRVVIIKLADRLHNMETLDALSPEKRSRIANETLDIYAPLAARLGIWQVKWQLEDHAFRYLHPAEYSKVAELVAKTRKERQEELDDAVVTLKERFEAKGMKNVEVYGRPKHLFSIFQKMAKQGVPFEQIHDLTALRIIVESVSDCYLALGIVHELWMPIPSLFYDYIAKPKSNGYQSLHTKVMGRGGDPLEVQIRTRAMHEVAEYGVAAHWGYKEGKLGSGEVSRLARLREQLFDWSSDAKLSSDFLRSISTDLFSEQVFVFSPKGDVLDLPRDSTPVDFAFRVHTELGMTTVGAKVNGVLVPLDTKLKNGDVVELITRSNASPSMDWLEFTKSAHARSKLRSYFRKLSKFQDAGRGRDAIERELKAMGLDAKLFLTEDKLQALLPSFEGCENPTDLFAKVGAGLASVQSVVTRLKGDVEERKKDLVTASPSREGSLSLAAHGVDNVLLRRAKCCSPIPGDDVLGYITRGRGIIIHRAVCPNAVALQSSEPERLMDLDWPADGKLHSVLLKITTVNRQGLLMDISTVFGETHANVSWAHIRTQPNNTAEIDVTIEVSGVDHLSQVMNRISNFSDVISIVRMLGKTAAK
jgi:guanosine-3',5'-bis(diphosphate) 3'-pyrophosphohydrolase